VSPRDLDHSRGDLSLGESPRVVAYPAGTEQHLAWRVVPHPAYQLMYFNFIGSALNSTATLPDGSTCGTVSRPLNIKISLHLYL